MNLPAYTRDPIAKNIAILYMASILLRSLEVLNAGGLP